ncbi:hypothetical protein [Mycoplasmopsis felis]|uniref:hypothetical protein n=1 Tax=Mycoplasmopsis felis TaxID=33923 RepID=UPI0021B07A0E|nr:hypothetical protein [Mycoplasmopsis felis]MCU9937623.1 hypothetical protein [Mycoplasmopsis felis]UWV84086.1 hypothetical protein NWE58_00945 [Mycoplasmopsis felis]WAM02630.1 hypothetical protein ONA02_02225 [Mycoplasmopsis felis]
MSLKPSSDSKIFLVSFLDISGIINFNNSFKSPLPYFDFIPFPIILIICPDS